MILPPILPVAAVCRSDESHVLRVTAIFMNARSERLRLPIRPLERPGQVAVLRGNAATAFSSLAEGKFYNYHSSYVIHHAPSRWDTSCLISRCAVIAAAAFLDGLS